MERIAGKETKKLLLLKSWRRHNSSCSKLIREDGTTPRKRGAEEDVEGCSFWVRTVARVAWNLETLQMVAGLGRSSRGDLKLQQHLPSKTDRSAEG